jgi:peroxiredoxin
MKKLMQGLVLVLGAAIVSAAVGAWYSHVVLARPAVLKVGEAFPDFNLKDSTGKEHTLAPYKDKIVVFNFCSQECPFSRGADPDINALAQTYAEKGIVFLGVDSNKDLSPADIQSHIESARISYPILKDEGNVLADAVGARVTPEIYVMGKDGTLVYHGPPDNRTGPNSAPTEHYLRDALEALLAGKPIDPATVKAWGCGIKRAQ